MSQAATPFSVTLATEIEGAHPEDVPGPTDLWPVEPDGNGLSLTRITPPDYGNDAQNWIAAEPSPGQ